MLRKHGKVPYLNPSSRNPRTRRSSPRIPSLCASNEHELNCNSENPIANIASPTPQQSLQLTFRSSLKCICDITYPNWRRRLQCKKVLYTQPSPCFRLGLSVLACLTRRFSSHSWLPQLDGSTQLEMQLRTIAAQRYTSFGSQGVL